MASYLSSAPRRAPASIVSNDDWKATAFVNFYLPTKEGKRKLGAISFTDKKKFDSAFIERMTKAEAIDAAIAAFKDALIIDFRLADDGKQIAANEVGF